MTWKIITNITVPTFNQTVFRSRYKSVTIKSQTVDAAGVSIQRHHTPVCLQIPTSTGAIKTVSNLESQAGMSYRRLKLEFQVPRPASASSSPDTCIGACSYGQVSVLTEQHLPNDANVALHHPQHFGFRAQAEKMHRSVLGAHGHQRSASVVQHPMGVLTVTQHDHNLSAACQSFVGSALFKQEVKLTRRTPLW